MPIDTRHPEYQANKEIWQKCIDFYNGEEAVKKAGKKYVPALSGQTAAKYTAYIERGPFFGSVSRTVSALAGAVFRKPPAVQLPTSVEYLRKDATGTGMSLVEVALSLTVEVMRTGRAGVLVDVPKGGGLPYLALYNAQDITNWDDSEAEPFTVLEECSYVRDPKDKYTLTQDIKYRELRLNEEGEYEVIIWTKGGPTNKKGEYIPGETVKPERRGRPMGSIPFCVVSPIGLDYGVDRPPILDMVNVLAAWWRASVDHANAIHTICVPTPLIAGNVDAEEFILNLGPDACIVLPEGSKADFLEFKGQGMSEVTKNLERLMDMQGALGARLITNTGNKTLIETAEGARIRESMSTAILGSIITSVEAALTKAVIWAADWVSPATEGVEIKLNKELVSSTLDANMVSALLNAVNQDKLSFESFYRALEEAGLTDPGISAEDEMDRIVNKVETPAEEAAEPEDDVTP